MPNTIKNKKNVQFANNPNIHTSHERQNARTSKNNHPKRPVSNDKIHRNAVSQLASANNRKIYNPSERNKETGRIPLHVIWRNALKLANDQGRIPVSGSTVYLYPPQSNKNISQNSKRGYTSQIQSRRTQTD
jgi:hypothetical protein